MSKKELRYKGYHAVYDPNRGEYLVSKIGDAAFFAVAGSSRQFHAIVDGVARSLRKTERSGDSIDRNYDEDKEFRSWWDLTEKQQLRFARKVRDESVIGWEGEGGLKEAAYKFGFTPDEDMPTVDELLGMVGGSMATTARKAIAKSKRLQRRSAGRKPAGLGGIR